MPDEAVLRIFLEGQGGAGPTGTTPRAGGGAGDASELPTAFDLVEKQFEQFGRKLQDLRNAMDSDALRQRVYFEQEVLEATRALRLAEYVERGQQGIPPRNVDLGTEQLNFWEKLEELQARLDPAMVEQYAQAAVDIGLAEKRLAEAREAAIEKIAPMAQVMAEPLTNLAADIGKVAMELQRLHEALSPEALRTQAALEIALADARDKAARALADEMERQAPTVIPVPEQPEAPGGGLLDQIFGLAKQFRGTLGGTFGRMVGGGLDVADIFSKSAGEAPQAATAYRASPGEAAGLAEVLPAEAPGASQGLADAAGPVAIALAVRKAIDEVGEALSGAVTSVGHFGAALLSADDNAAHSVEVMGQAAAKAADAIATVDPILGVFARSAAAAVGALGELMGAVQGLADRYGAFSPGIAQAQAIADVAQTLADFRRAQQVTPELVAFTREQLVLQQKYEDAKARILQRIMPEIIVGMRAMEKLIPLIEANLAVIEFIARQTIPGLGQKLDQIKAEIAQQAEAAEKDWGWFDAFINSPTLPDVFGPGGFTPPPNTGPSGV